VNRGDKLILLVISDVYNVMLN